MKGSPNQAARSERTGRPDFVSFFIFPPIGVPGFIHAGDGEALPAVFQVGAQQEAAVCQQGIIRAEGDKPGGLLTVVQILKADQLPHAGDGSLRLQALAPKRLRGKTGQPSRKNMGRTIM